jgi:nucleoside-diphosphate-sugar epimerase
VAKTALIIGGSGQIGQATCSALARDGWTVVCAQRDCRRMPVELTALGVSAVTLDRARPGAVASVMGPGIELLIDTVAFDESHARQLLEVQSDVGAFVVISSASVYRDERGRTLDEAGVSGFPLLAVPIGEDQPTVAAGPRTYSTRKVALEETLLEKTSRPVVFLRPCAIHGPGSRHPREWFFVKRILDGRRVVPLAWNGESRFHTSATANIAELIRIVSVSPRTQVLNIADPEAPTVLEIGDTIADAYGYAWRLAGFDGPPFANVGASPWSIPRPFVVDMSRAEALGYRPVVSYSAAAAAACRSAEAAARAGVAFPDYLATMFNYPAEDRFIREHQLLRK